MSIEEAMSLAEARWRGLEFRRKTANEASSSCPLCRQADQDGFLVFGRDGERGPRYWCRKCNESGFLDERDPGHRLTEAEIAEIRLQAIERKQREQDRRLSALERLNRTHAHERYHANLDEDGYNWWMEKGCKPQTILDYQLGYCPRCPTDREHRPSYTIPLWDPQHHTLWNLRHRLKGVRDGDKYRPELAGLGTCLAFPHHLVGAERGIIVEGEVKAMVAAQHGLPAVGLMGKRGTFKGAWLNYFPEGGPIYIALDPDAAESAERLGNGIAKTGKQTYVASLPEKIDDMLVQGGTVADVEFYLKLGRRVH